MCQIDYTTKYTEFWLNIILCVVRMFLDESHFQIGRLSKDFVLSNTGVSSKPIEG